MALENLIVFNKAYSLAMEVFDATKRFPGEERYLHVNN
ncbi:MAG: four helix bundle protein [Chitinophagaceae bacterium]|nr:four helix bundle protein [Chitinophagaceae bacterium]